jgi:hypothetical protein
MALTRDFRETVQARVKAFRKGLLSEAIEGLLSGDVSVGKELGRPDLPFLFPRGCRQWFAPRS